MIEDFLGHVPRRVGSKALFGDGNVFVRKIWRRITQMAALAITRFNAVRRLDDGACGFVVYGNMLHTPTPAQGNDFRTLYSSQSHRCRAEEE